MRKRYPTSKIKNCLECGKEFEAGRVSGEIYRLNCQECSWQRSRGRLSPNLKKRFWEIDEKLEREY
jgi:DNA-directed RNA polymerase subunit RPC12/RpoP